MTIDRISQRVKLLIGLIVASTVSFPISSAHAATLYAANHGDNIIHTIDTLTGQVSAFATTGVSLSIPDHLAFAPDGTLYEADRDGKINKIASNGVVTNFASGLGYIGGLTVDLSGNVFAIDNDAIVKFTPGGVRSTFAPAVAGESLYGLAFDPSGNLFASALTPGLINKFTPGGAKSTFASSLYFPTALASDSTGNLYSVEGAFNNFINKFTPGGNKSTLASGLGPDYSLAFDPSSGNLFTGGGTTTILQVAPDGSVSTLASGGGLYDFRTLAIAPTAAPSSAVPEPFTIIGTLIGGTAALRMRKKLRANSSENTID